MKQLPDGWTTTSLGNLIDRIEAGLNVRCVERPPSVEERGLVKISAVTWGRFDEEQSKTLPADAVVDERHRIRAGNLLISRANTIELVGATVIVEKISKKLYLSDKVLRLVTLGESQRWLNYALKTADVRKCIQEASSGNQLSMRNISQDKLRAIQIPLAPAAEQKRIADKLDAVLARVDGCRERLDRVPSLLKRFRQSVLDAATSGRLTRDWRATDDIEGWTHTTLNGVLRELRNGLSPKPSEQPPGRKILRISAVRSGRVDFEDHRYLDIDDATASQYSVRAGDILFTRYNGSLDFVGVCALVRQELEDYVYPDKLIRVRVDETKVLPAYVELAFASSDVRHQIEAFVKSSAGQKGISGGDLKTTRFRLPPVEEQHEIVRRTETLFAYSDRLEVRLAQSWSAMERLTPALLAKAFRGELAPQDPNDEPASELLRRLAEQCSDGGKAEKGERAKRVAPVVSSDEEPTTVK